MIYKGSCHCGNIAFEVDGDLTGAMACNCSICSRKGALMWFVPRDKLRLISEIDVGTYTFNKHAIRHCFCRACGCGPFGEGVNPKTGEATLAVNVRCLHEVDLAALTVVPFDGASL